MMVRFGVIGAGNITRAFCEALKKTSGLLYGIASRSIEKAVNYQKEFGFEVAYGSYEDLMRDPNVDVIYIATPHSHHYEQMLAALKYGKHILCEKAFTLNLEQATHVLNLAREKKLFVMEAMWTRFLPVINQVKQNILDGLIGNIKQLECNFGFVANQIDEGRLFNPKLGGGALLDIGIYPLTIFDLFVGFPNDVDVTAKMYHTGVDVALDIVLKKDQVVGHLKASFSENLGVHATIFGEHGYVEIPHFIGAKEAIFYDQNHQLVKKIEVTHLANGMEYEIAHVIEMIESKAIESPVMTHQKTLSMMRLMDLIQTKF